MRRHGWLVDYGREPDSAVQRAVIVCQSIRPAQVRATTPGRLIWHRTHCRPSRGCRGIPPCGPGDRMGCQGSALFPHSLPEAPDCLRAPDGRDHQRRGVTVMPRARRSRRWLKGLNAPSPARCRSRAWIARNPARASRSASVKGRLDRGEPCETKPRWMHGSSRRGRRTPRARPPGAAGSAFVHAEMTQLWLLPDVLVRLAGDGGGAPARPWSAQALSTRQRGEGPRDG
jgi:hypothetical protein